MIVPEFSAIAHFCDDIREEQAGIFSVTGLGASNAVLPEGAFERLSPEKPLLLPRLGILVTCHIRMDHIVPNHPIVVRLYAPGEEVVMSEIGSDVIDAAFVKAQSEDHPFPTFFAKVKASPYPVKGVGFVSVTAEYRESGEILAGFLKLLPSDPTASDLAA